MRRSVRILPVAASALLLALTACAGRQKVDPIPDTPDAKAVLAVIGTYREAMNHKDVATIVSLASRDYHDEMGTTDADDDVTYEDLKTKLDKDFADVTALRLDIQVRAMDFGPRDETAQVSYRYDVRYQLKLPSGEKWHNALDVNRMKLRHEADGWKIVSGL